MAAVWAPTIWAASIPCVPSAGFSSPNLAVALDITA